jgi:hypothetical protein
MYRADGTLLKIVRWNDSGAPVDATFLRELIAQTMPDATEEQIERMVASELTTAQPATLPFYQQIKVDGAGRLWVFDYPNLLSMGDWQPVWTVFSPEGQPIGRVRIPALSRARRTPILASITDDEVLLRWIDNDLGFKHLTVHTLRPIR